ncbi:MAG: dockerin type I domain-containing protein [Clostridiales bacterium]|nr:dockerin type I domain-containing protein [Clostridiales bacterium]
MKKILCWIVVFGLFFSLGVNVYAKDGLSFQYYEAAARIDGEMAIKTVEVLYGGLEQSSYRTQEYSAYTATVYKGDHATLAVNGEDASKYYTTSRVASMTDPRVFTVEFNVDKGDFVGVGEGSGEFNPKNIAWMYGGKSLSAWARVSGGTGSPLSAEATAVLDGDKIIVTAKVRFDNFYSELVPSTSNNRNLPYRPYYGVVTPNRAAGDAIIANTGSWELEAVYGAASLAKTEIRMAQYDAFKTTDEVDAYARSVIGVIGADGGVFGSKGRFLRFESIGKTYLGRDLWMAVVSNSEASINEYETVTRPLMLENPQKLIDMIKNKEPGYDKLKVPLSFSSMHGEEILGSDICMTMIDKMLNEDVVKFTKIKTEDTQRRLPTNTGYSGRGWTEEKAGAGYDDITFVVDEFLDQFIMTFLFTANPDGRAQVNRSPGYNYDPNVDVSFMASSENRANARNIARWDPLIQIDYHGYYDTFIIDGYTPPYAPSLEYDLIDKYWVRAINSLGHSMIGKAPYNKFSNMKNDCIFEWDCGANFYTATFAMLYGALGTTLEFPHATQDSVDAGMSGTFGYMKFCMDNRDEMYLDKLENKRRGVENIDAESANNAFVNINKEIDDIKDQLSFGATLPERVVIGRPSAGEGKSFFPEYYVIPIDPDMQKGPGVALEFLKMVSDLKVKVGATTEPVTVDGVNYPAGTYVIDMRHGNRGVAHSLIYEGYDASIYPVMYSRLVCAYPDLRGFDCHAVYEAGAFSGVVNDLSGSLAKLESSIPGADAYVMVKNKDLDAIRLINRILNGDGEAYIVNGYIGMLGAVPGDFIVKRQDFVSAVNEGENKAAGPIALYVNGADAGNTLPDNVVKAVKPRIGLAGGTGQQPAHMLGLMEFEDYVMCGTNSAYPDANVYLNFNASNTAMANHIMAEGIPVVVQRGATFLNSILDSGNRITFASFSGGEALALGSYAADSYLTANHENINSMYISSGSFLRELPGFMKPLATVSTEDGFFRAGYWYSASGTAAAQANLKGSHFAAAGVYTMPSTGKAIPMAVFTDNIPSNIQNHVAYHIAGNALLNFASGNEVFFDPSAVSKVEAALSVDAVTGIEGDAEFTLGVYGATDMLAAELEFEIDGGLLSAKGIVGLNGFEPMNDVFWRYAGGNKWVGEVTLAYKAGDDTGFATPANTTVDIAKFVFGTNAEGDATMKLTGFRVVGLDGGTTEYIDSMIVLPEATTSIEQTVFSKYDLNRDNKVDALDLGIMLLYCGFDSDDPRWDVFVKVNDSRGKGVTAKMCDVNGDGMIDMLDLLDLFIHYTK